MRDAALLVRLLRAPEAAISLSPDEWTTALTVARAESLLGTLAHRLIDTPVPPRVDTLLSAARVFAAEARAKALWEAEMARRALSGMGVPLILLKGTAYAAASLDAAEGRSIGDLDVLVPRDGLAPVEQALLAAEWEWVKPDAYDDHYYREWMHELPPLIHRARDRMIDVHHTILPLTAKPRPDAAQLIARSIQLGDGLAVLSPADMVVHAAAHLFADGDLAGGLRNLWDIDRLVREFARDANFWSKLEEAMRAHALEPAVSRALRLAGQLYGTPVDPHLAGARTAADRFYVRRLLARDGWGRERHPVLRLSFYLRSHWLRMPPLMLARHLWIKARR